LVALATFIFLAYRFSWDWTGFSQKRLFDWIQILVIPGAIAVGTFVLNRAAKKRDDLAQQEQREREQTIETERAEEASLQAYLDYMSRMLTDSDRPLRRSHMGDNLSVAARAHTLTVLARLEDGARKGSVIRFLYEANLIRGKYHPVINLSGANLGGANIQFAALDGAILQEANLAETNLGAANLKGAHLLLANLQRAHLGGANLQGANLQGANLQGANLQGANLQGADLRYAKGLTQDQIEQAIGDNYTTLPKGIDRPKSWCV